MPSLGLHHLKNIFVKHINYDKPSMFGQPRPFVTLPELDTTQRNLQNSDPRSKSTDNLPPTPKSNPGTFEYG